jgi:hypothetical protein
VWSLCPKITELTEKVQNADVPGQLMPQNFSKARKKEGGNLVMLFEKI